MKVPELSGLSQQPLSLCFVADVQYQDVMAQVMPRENFCHTEGKNNMVFFRCDLIPQEIVPLRRF